jgi:hypothetical protein
MPLSRIKTGSRKKTLTPSRAFFLIFQKKSEEMLKNKKGDVLLQFSQKRTSLLNPPLKGGDA